MRRCAGKRPRILPLPQSPRWDAAKQAQGGTRQCRTSPAVRHWPSAPRRWPARLPRDQSATPGGIPRTEGGALRVTPEAGASLRVIRPARFVEPDEVVFRPNAQRFQDRFNIPVRVDFVGWEDIRPQTAVIANTGTGPDIVIGWSDDPHIYADKVIELADVAEYLGKRYGGWGSWRRSTASKHGTEHLDRHPLRRQHRPLHLAHLRGEGGRVRQHPGRP